MPETWGISVTKVPLKSLIKEPDKTIPILSNYLKHSNTIVTLGYQLIRLYILTKFKNEEELPNISGKFCENALSVICFPDKPRPNDTQIALLQEFYNTSFKNLIHKDLKFDPKHLSSVCQSSAKSMTTALHNNIAVHFIKRLKKAINFQLKKLELFSNLELEPKHFRFMSNIVFDALWDKDTSELPKELLEVYQTCLERYIPPGDYEECLGYDLEANTQKYLKPTLVMNRDFEEAGWKIFQPLSLRNTAIPKHITIDTKTLLYLFDFSGVTQYNKSDLLKNYRKLDI